METVTVVSALREKRLALIHRVLVPDKEYPKEYAILVTDLRSIFIRQPKTRRSWVLRQEMRFGTALVTDVEPRTLDDFEDTSPTSLANTPDNLVIEHHTITSFEMRADQPKPRWRDFFVFWVMKKQNEIFQVYNFEITCSSNQTAEVSLKFYAVPLGVYFKPRRMTQTRETILREYATDILETYRRVLPASLTSSVIATQEVREQSEFLAWTKRLL